MNSLIRPVTVFVPLLLATALTAWFWWPLWLGGGLIGGDTYAYYLPQKLWYAERLHAGELPLWNSLAGHGYPLIAESQTGAFYPVNLALYWMCDVNDAYNFSHLLHCIGTFCLTTMFAQRLRLSLAASLLTSLIFTFGWFPPRVCLEWAIIGGFWFAWALWSIESFLQTARLRFLMLFALGIGMHMLAGHFHLAFLTLLTIVAYVPLRLWSFRDWLAEKFLQHRIRCGSTVSLAILLGFGLAAVQLWPSWELKQLSQRATVGRTFDPGYGHLPPLYLSQVWLPWLWYSPEIDTDKALRELTTLAISSGTNKIEAHLYFGLVPWLLLLTSLFVRREPLDDAQRRTRRLWLILSGLAIIYSTGWLMPVSRYLPGFSFFQAPGRYGMIATWGLALIFGIAFDRLVRSDWRNVAKVATFVVVFGLTAFDLSIISSWVTNAIPLLNPPIHQRSSSEIFRKLQRSSQPLRLHAPGPNLPTLLGVASTPPYLGLAPFEYFDPQLKMPEPDPATHLDDPKLIDQQVDWLRRGGVTHLLRFEPIDQSVWPTKLVWQGVDSLLHQSWGRSPNEPLYLYELQGTRGRAAFIDSSIGGSAEVSDYQANQVTLVVTSANGGEVVLTDLFYPGWDVTIDNEPANAHRVDGLFRGITVAPGQHTVVWTFRPTSVRNGAIISVLALLLMIGIGVRHRMNSSR